MRAHRPKRAGFSLLEVITVVFILAVLASVVVPQFSYSTVDAEDAVLMRNLQYVRRQIELFRAQHLGRPPGFGGTHAWLHMLLYTNSNGDVALTKSASYPLGPYLTNSALTNPANGGMAIKTSADPSSETPNEALTDGGAVVGWFYDPTTGRVAPNSEGNTTSGIPRVQL